MSREKFEADLKRGSEELKSRLQDDYIDEATKMDAKRGKLLAQREKIDGKIAEIEGKPESGSEKEEQAETFKFWRTVELGNGLKTAEDFEKALKEAGREISDEARKMLKEVEKEISQAASYGKRKVDLFEATPAELGLPDGGTLDQIYTAAAKNDFERCLEAGPQSAIQYEDQPKDDYRLIGADNRRAFRVIRSLVGKRWLYARDCAPGLVWDPVNHFVWVRRKKSEFKP